MACVSNSGASVQRAVLVNPIGCARHDIDDRLHRMARLAHACSAIMFNSDYDIPWWGFGVMKVDPAQALDVFDLELSVAEVTAVTVLETGRSVSSHPDGVN